MSNRIPIIGQKPGEPDPEVPLNLSMTHGEGTVQIMFDPPVVRMRLQPREARTLAIAMLTHAEAAENPPPIIEMPPGN
jgi:hypothetical protein